MLNLGYGVFWDNISNEKWTIHSLKTSLKIGWKLIFSNGIFLEPIIGYGFPLY